MRLTQPVSVDSLLSHLTKQRSVTSTVKSGQFWQICNLASDQSMIETNQSLGAAKKPCKHQKNSARYIHQLPMPNEEQAECGEQYSIVVRCISLAKLQREQHKDNRKKTSFGSIRCEVSQLGRSNRNNPCQSWYIGSTFRNWHFDRFPT